MRYFGLILLLHRGCLLSEVTLYHHGSNGVKEFILYREVKCIVSFIWSVL